MKTKVGQSVILIIFMFVLMAGSFYVTDDARSEAVYIYLIRHGQTCSNVQGMLVGGDGNYDLTSKGIDDAVSLGTRLRDTSFQAVYSSPLGRAYDTANYILQGACQENLEVARVEDLRDISWGEAEGYTAQEFVEKYELDEFPDAFGDANDPNFISPIQAESKYGFCNRFSKALLEIIGENEKTGGNVLVVAHSSMSFWLQRQFPEKNLGNLENTTTTVLKYENAKWELLMYNGEEIVQQ